MAEQETSSVRLDKWLWAARFFKTRALASEAVSGGKVHVNGQRVRPARAVKTGDELRIVRGVYTWVVQVRGLSAKRGPASVAQQLYEETAASRAERETRAVAERMQRAAMPIPTRRPNKKDRRRLMQLRHKD